MKKRIGILFGGKSGEHEVSVQSAESIRRALDKSTYSIATIGIDKQGVKGQIKELKKKRDEALAAKDHAAHQRPDPQPHQ